jgi:hypothetical protein
MTGRSWADGEHPIQGRALSLDEGQQAVFNDRSRPLTVTGRHARPSGHRSNRPTVDDELTVIELEGNGTEYHLLCQGGSTTKPVLYSAGQWDEPDGDAGDARVRYTGSPTRVESLELIE